VTYKQLDAVVNVLLSDDNKTLLYTTNIKTKTVSIINNKQPTWWWSGIGASTFVVPSDLLLDVVHLTNVLTYIGLDQQSEPMSGPVST